MKNQSFVDIISKCFEEQCHIEVKMKQGTAKKGYVLHFVDDRFIILLVSNPKNKHELVLIDDIQELCRLQPSAS